MKKLFAAIGFFTRIPVWKITDIPSDKYKRIVDLWPAAGWITGGLTALTLWGALQVLPPFAAVVTAFAVRLLLTGALHEDGLADFIDGTGGGSTRERILEIMKDSRIGSYGVIGLVIYFMLLVSCVASLPPAISPLAVLAADPWSKFCGSFIINTLPYARKQEEAKNKIVYDRMSAPAFVICLLSGLLPAILLPEAYWLALLLPMAVAAAMILYMRCKIGGYTGDCCGATALLCELAFYFSSAVIAHAVIQ